MEEQHNNPLGNTVPLHPTSGLVFLSDEQIENIPSFKTLTNYLVFVSQNGKLARKSEIDPAKIKKLLPDIFILDLVREDGEVTDLTIRLMGTGLAQFYGEHTNKSINRLENTEAVARIFTSARKCAEVRKNIAIDVASLSVKKPHLRATGLYCPLQGNGHQIEQILGLVVVRSILN